VQAFSRARIVLSGVEVEVAQGGRRSDVEVERLQITLMKDDVTQLDRVVRIGKLGRNRNEVAARIINDWLHDQSPSVLQAYLAFRDGGEEYDKRMLAREKAAT
jgi:hypothetical protein